MRFIKKLLIKLFKIKDNRPWLEYYSKEDKKIKFTKKNIYEYLVYSVGTDMDYTALNYFGNKISYSELFDNINLMSRALKQFGIKEKDVVTICMPNTPEAIIAFYACNNIGAIADMIHPLSSANEIKYYLNSSKSKLLFLLDSNYEKVNPILSETNVKKTVLLSPKISMPLITNIGYELTRGYKVKKPLFYDNRFITYKEFIKDGYQYLDKISSNMTYKDIALILHSGGTTGTPKGITLSNYNFNALAMQCGVLVSSAKPKDKLLTILPIFHGFGLGVCVHCPLTLKIETILVPEFNAKTFHKLFKTHKPNMIAGVPTLWEAMMSNKNFDNVNLSSLKYVISGGDYLSVPFENKMNEFLRLHGANVKVTKGYGMTESVAATSYTFEGTNEPGSIGIPLVGNSFCVCKPNSTDTVEFGEEGELCVSGPTVMQGYLNNKKETDNVLKLHKDGKVWLHTGDLGYITNNGLIYFTGRIKRMIISSGFNIYPSLIESVIEAYPGVDKCCVIQVPHKYKMHVPKAIVVLKKDVKPNNKIKKDLMKLCKNNLALYSLPSDIEFVNSLPKTLYNKIDYRKLEEEALKLYEEKRSNEKK